jgi:hypothetical protein
MEASKRLGVPPQNCLVYTDSCASMQAIMVPNLERPTNEVEDMARCVLPSLEAVLVRLTEFFRYPNIR